MSERGEVLKYERILEQAASDIRAGRHLSERQPSKLDPHENMAAIRARGKEMIEAAEAVQLEAQTSLVAIYETAKVRASEAAIAASRKYNIELPVPVDYDEAFAASAGKVLQSCWDADYEDILFDQVFIQVNGAHVAASSAQRNAAYDKLIELDGTRFSVSVPQDIELVQKDGGAGYAFKYADQAENSKHTALLVIEIIVPELGSDQGLMRMGAMDLETFELVANQVLPVNAVQDLYEGLQSTASTGAEMVESAETPSAEKVAEAPSSESAPETEVPVEATGSAIAESGRTHFMPSSLLVSDPQHTIDRLAALPTPYVFQVEAGAITDAGRAARIACLLESTLFDNSKLKLSAGSFVLSSYKGDLENLPKVLSDAILMLEEDGNAPLESYKFSAISKASQRTIEIGTAALEFPGENVAETQTTEIK
ncbi:hypothetical protein [Coraliomargarita parva]|uniref:hypothetical protein n=1 Tax=Coraliomargarita parva TaxID=3014050 RepID=UPI0022B3762B|nr:hypothetical protein [Coraliomargarita parva]